MNPHHLLVLFCCMGCLVLSRYATAVCEEFSLDDHMNNDARIYRVARSSVGRPTINISTRKRQASFN